MGKQLKSLPAVLKSYFYNLSGVRIEYLYTKYVPVLPWVNFKRKNDFLTLKYHFSQNKV